MGNESLRQKGHYERIHDLYAQHYYDPISMSFRERFVYDILFQGLDLNHKTVADLACGSGFNSLAILKRYPQAQVTGFDISSKACEAYKSLTGRPANEIDLTLDTDNGFRCDVALIIGGLHHCAYDLPAVFSRIGRMVKPGGLLLMYEPNHDYFLQGLRRLWYRSDALFDYKTEEALNHTEITKIAAQWFSPLSCQYAGGLAYFVIFNSMVMRIPLGLKRLLAPGLFVMEDLFNRLPCCRIYPTFLARWIRV